MSILRESKIPRLTRLRLLHYPKTYGMSFASPVEIEDVLHYAPCRLHIPNSYGMECPSYEKVLDFPLNSASAFALSEDLRYVCASSVEIEDVSHFAPCRLHVPNSYGTECPSYEISRLTRLRLLHYPKTYGMSFASPVEIEDVSHCLLYTSPSPRD